jgi:formylglycine-generating enzyme required for sulfatase activity
MRWWIIVLCTSFTLAGATIEPATSQENLQPGAVFRDCDGCPELVVIPAGSFKMGTPMGAYERLEREGPQISVSLAKPFAMGRFELTVAQFRAFTAETGHEPTPGCRIWNEMWTDSPAHGWQRPGQPERLSDELPVVCVSWLDAKAYLKWLSEKTGKPYRLPSESEWEYAARAGTQTARFWGEAWNEGCEYANLYDITGRKAYPYFDWVHAACSDNHADLAPVGSYKPNAFGLHDMIGNVWEWTEDCYTASYVGAPKDGRPWVWEGGCERRSIRGGSWITTPARSRVAYRGRDPVDRHANYFGFRVARNLAPNEIAAIESRE